MDVSAHTGQFGLISAVLTHTLMASWRLVWDWMVLNGLAHMSGTWPDISWGDLARPGVSHHPETCLHINDHSTSQRSQKNKHFTGCFLHHMCYCPIGQAKSLSGPELPKEVNKRETQLQKPTDLDALIIYHPSL